MLATPPVYSNTPLKGPSGLGHDFESEGEAVEAPQLAHGRGHVQGQLACTTATDQGGASHPGEGRHPKFGRGASL
jgi:hypothetical protein